jgi:hypothetical protein
LDVDAVVCIPGVVVVDASGVEGNGVSVGRAKPDFVGGRVEVTNGGGASVAFSGETVMHEEVVRTIRSARVQSFFMDTILLCKDEGVLIENNHKSSQKRFFVIAPANAAGVARMASPDDTAPVVRCRGAILYTVTTINFA